MIEIKKATEEMMKLNRLEVGLVIIELLKENRLSFPDMVQLYINDLNRREQELKDKIMPLAMNLGLAVKGNLDKQAARKLIHEAGYFQDSPFGKELEKEFKSNKT